ncbi:MAG: ADP-ribose pyrophosphatase [Bacillales bacterium]|jgi:ADP-ribose pyrophosphatase|nr:ADP-ribose pyrophosphatase [Bacillales bacterium]
MYKYEEKTLNREEIFTGKVIKVFKDEVELPDGKTSTREIVKHPGAVAVIAQNDQGKIILVEQYRKALERPLLEVPAGKIEVGELPELTAKRELEEETGYECGSLELMYSFYTSPGFADELIYLYEAKYCRKLEDSAGLDEDEFVDIIEVSLQEAEVLIKEGRIKDAKTIIAIQYLKSKLC